MLLINGKEANNLIIGGKVFTKENHIGKKGAAYGEGETETTGGKTVQYFFAFGEHYVPYSDFDPRNTYNNGTYIPNGTEFIVKGETDNDWLLVELLENTKIDLASGNTFVGTKGELYWLNKKINNGDKTKIIYSN